MSSTQLPERFDHPQLKDVVAANARLLTTLIQFRAWQTNYPASRPHLWEALTKTIESVATLEKQLEQMRDQHPPTLQLEQRQDSRRAALDETQING